MKFYIDFNGSFELDEDEIWPDGDAPPQPTAADVIKAMKQCGSKAGLIDEWSFADDLIIGICTADGDDRANW